MVKSCALNVRRSSAARKRGTLEERRVSYADDAAAFALFCDGCVQAYLAARRFAPELLAMGFAKPGAEGEQRFWTDSARCLRRGGLKQPTDADARRVKAMKKWLCLPRALTRGQLCQSSFLLRPSEIGELSADRFEAAVAKAKTASERAAKAARRAASSKASGKAAAPKVAAEGASEELIAFWGGMAALLRLKTLPQEERDVLGRLLRLAARAR